MGAIQSNVHKLFLTMKTHQVKTLLFFSLLLLSLFSCKKKEVIINLPSHPSAIYHRPYRNPMGVMEVKVLDVQLLPDSTFISCRDSTTISSPQIPFCCGDISGFYTDLVRNMRYPQASLDNGMQGRVVASFIVGMDGITKDIKIEQWLDKPCDEEVLRVLNLFARSIKWYWHPSEERANEAVKFFVGFRFIIE